MNNRADAPNMRDDNQSGHIVENKMDNIDSSHALIVQDAEGGFQSIFHKIRHAYYRTIWRTPLHRARLSGKAPLKLLAAPIDPFSGDEVRGSALRAGKMQFRGMDLDMRDANLSAPVIPPDFTDYLHRMDWLRDLSACANRGQIIAIAEKYCAAWLEENGGNVKNEAWRGDNIVWRFINMAHHAPLILSSRNSDYRRDILNHFADMADEMDKIAPMIKHDYVRVVIWCGVLAAGLLLPDGKERLTIGQDALKKALDKAIYNDGGLASRSPAQLIECCKLLILTANIYTARGMMRPQFLDQHIAKIIPAILCLRHSDGGLGAWQGSGHGTTNLVEQILSASPVTARPQRQSKTWGYQRISAGKSVLIIDAGPPPLAKNAWVSCASTLAIEFSFAAQRIFINCGGGALASHALPADLARGLRTTAAHSTLCVENVNSTAILPEGKLGKGVNIVDLERRDEDQLTRLTASHDGYVRNFGFIHQRSITLRSDGLEMRGSDILLPAEKAKPKAETQYEIRFHLGPNIDLYSGEEKGSILLRLRDGSSWLFQASQCEVNVEDSLWVNEEGEPAETQQIILTHKSEQGGSSTNWSLQFIG
ncbi:hypothetical protein LPB140_00710 [Sphingorhabdus lutea]|uniref:Heparinase II/III-like C-terminal domain-containing protein n=1 Tax=Sphingorhabdus lutea TaxID=1913578 RepID=A0A1L3J8Z0_9SPHN|nr:heparinase II/III family protein [Sphingorhabdus lutea]APG61606.1 hypothetical protein LPB140_00710 [Sphingorhabdus lutea]